MNLLTDNIKTLYFKYLYAAFGSAMILCVYSIVDMAIVGQYQGPSGTAALAVVAPIWNIIFSLGLLMGIGGSVLFSIVRGNRNQKVGLKLSNEFFTTSVIGAVIISIIIWAFIIFFEKEILIFFGADETLLYYAEKYMLPILFAIPVFLFNQMLAAFLRNDNNPNLATIGVLSGGIFNIVGDYVFVFTFNMGIFGAGLATAIGAVISFIVLISHFFTRKNTMRFVRPKGFIKKIKQIGITGFSTFFIDIAMGILTILFNRQIMLYLGSDALAVYGPIINISTFVQSCAYSVGQAAQPIISMNFGARSNLRIKEVLKYALYTVAFFSIFWTALSLAYPNLYVRIFMNPTENILRIAPEIIRAYSISFILLPLNIFATYYFQAIVRPKAAFAISVLRGLVLSGALILILPKFFGGDSIWYAMPITETLIAILAVFFMIRYTKKLV